MTRSFAALGAVLFAALAVPLAFAQVESEPFGPNPPGAPPPPPPPSAQRAGAGGPVPPAASGQAPSASASSPPGSAEGAVAPDGGAPASSASAEPPDAAGPPPLYPPVTVQPVYPTIPPELDDGAAKRRTEAEHRVLVSRIDVSGTVTQGLDATDAPLRQGGFRLGGSYRIADDFVFSGYYAFSSGHVIERLPGNRAGQFGVPNDVDVLESRHVFDATFGYVLHTHGPIRFFGVPFLGPRVPVLVNSVAPRWAFEAEFGARAGVAASDSFEAAALVAYAPAIAKATGLADVQGPLLGELRFGLLSSVRAGGPFFLTLGYEGNVLVLSHEKITAHSLLAGLSYALE